MSLTAEQLEADTRERCLFEADVYTTDGIRVRARVVAVITRDETPTASLGLWAEVEHVEALAEARCGCWGRPTSDGRYCEFGAYEGETLQLPEAELERLVRQAENMEARG